MHRVLSRVAGIMPGSQHSGVTLSALHVLYHHRALPFSPLHTPCSHAASRAGGQPVSFIGYYRCGCLRRRGFTWSSGDAGICHAPALNERRRRRRRRRRREPAHRRTAPADSGEAAAAIPSDTTGASHRGANSPPRRCLRSHVFDGLLASKRGTARLETRTIQQHCIKCAFEVDLVPVRLGPKTLAYSHAPFYFCFKKPLSSRLPAPVPACFFFVVVAMLGA